MASFFARFNRNQNNLSADLKRVTESGIVEIPKELLDLVVEASLGEDDRREIMQHLRECLAEPSSRRWRRVHAALVLVEELAKRGPRELLIETAQGHHFDLVQRLSLLEHFECANDRRVQNMVRTKATALRAEMLSRLQAAGDEGTLSCGSDAVKDTASTCSPGLTSIEGSSTGSTGNNSPSSAPPSRPEGRMILNGIVAVGHNDDSTDEESSDDDGPKKAVKYQKERRRKAAAQNSDSDDSGPRSRPQQQQQPTAAKPMQASPPSVDLLDL